MSIAGWIVIAILGLNVVFFGVLALIDLIERKAGEKKHEQRKTGR